MTAPSSQNDVSVRQRRLRRRVALAVVLTLIGAGALLTPEIIGGRTGDGRLTTYSAEAQGARLLYELAGRLGWRTSRWTDGPRIDADSGTMIGILDPPEPVSAVEAHHLLDQVRSGAALLYVMDGSSPLNDSLHVKRSLFGGTYQATAAGTADVSHPITVSDSLRARRFDSAHSDTAVDDEEIKIPTECTHISSDGALAMWPDQTVHLWRFQWTRPRPAATVIFARSAVDSRDTTVSRSAAAAAGFPLGAGRVVIIADADLLRNDVLRVCRWGLDVTAVRMLEYLTVGSPKRDRLVFDEYHQGFGAHPGTLRAIVAYLARASSGHVLLQAMLGGLVLLLALGPRALPPRDSERVERRSPLEHVGALAQAYARVGATRTATGRLLHGVRRRVERKGVRDAPSGAEESDARFLDMVQAAPSRSDDVALIRRALTSRLTRREFEAVGAALKRIEDSLLAERR